MHGSLVQVDAPKEPAGEQGLTEFSELLRRHPLPQASVRVQIWNDELLADRKHAKGPKRTRALAHGRYSPQTANTIVEVLRQVMAEASEEFNIADPCRKLDNVSMRGHRTYTYEEPNAIKPADVPRLLAGMLRPSSLRPLRRSGVAVGVRAQPLRLDRTHPDGGDRQARPEAATASVRITRKYRDRRGIIEAHLRRSATKPVLACPQAPAAAPSAASVQLRGRRAQRGRAAARAPVSSPPAPT